MTYDEAIEQVETIVKSLEQAEAISVTEYKKKAQEAKKLLDFCEQQIGAMEKDLLV
ncbi:MAG: exodeoxyribonuclease VII small subunit [Paludibacteraceae bacterium]|nr:exodeoxyribonuclease VII small subunit [Paludibacteraceae bacterium]